MLRRFVAEIVRIRVLTAHVRICIVPEKGQQTNLRHRSSSSTALCAAIVCPHRDPPTTFSRRVDTGPQGRQIVKQGGVRQQPLNASGSGSRFSSALLMSRPDGFHEPLRGCLLVSLDAFQQGTGVEHGLIMGTERRRPIWQMLPPTDPLATRDNGLVGHSLRDGADGPLKSWSRRSRA